MTPVRAYHAIRLAMMGGMLLLGLVSWVLHRSADWQPPPAGVADGLVTVGLILWGAAAVALVFLFVRRQHVEDPQRRVTTAIIAWSVGEALAIFGGVHFYLTAVPVWYVAGLLAMSITFVAFPPPAPR
ncbi:MAG: hypothetical protein HUU26_15175 [Gemmatimonadaceae bacterium]|nr:hypothetical protein [Gemmatimonadaceae bacterium]